MDVWVPFQVGRSNVRHSEEQGNAVFSYSFQRTNCLRQHQSANAEDSNRETGSTNSYNREMLLKLDPSLQNTKNSTSSTTVDLRRRTKWGRMCGHLPLSISRSPLPFVILTNLRLIKNKMVKVREYAKFCCKFHEASLLCFTESWLLLPSMSDSRYKIEGFTLVRADRSIESGKSKGGGICVYINDLWCQKYTVKDRICNGNVEILSMTLTPREFGCILLFVVYVPPSGKASEAAAIIADSVRKEQQTYPDVPAIVLGDLNQCKLDRVMPGFHQYVRNETRKEKVLDKCFVNVKRAYESRIRPPIAKSDHNVIHLIPTYRSKLKSRKPEEKELRVQTPERKEELEAYFQCRDRGVFQQGKLEESTTVTSDNMNFCAHAIIPTKKIKKKTCTTKDIKHAMNRRRHAFKNKDWGALKLAGKDLREKLREAKHEHRKHLKDDFQTNNPGRFRDITKNMAGTSSSRKPSSSEDNVEFSDSLNRYSTGFEIECNGERCDNTLKGENRVDPGVYWCSSRRCDCCGYMKANIRQFESRGTKKSYSIREVLTCDTKSVVYVIECQKCRKRFVEKTVGPLKKRFSNVKNSVLKKQHRPVSRHFNSDGHSLTDLRIFPIEQVNDSKKLKEREEYWNEELVLLDFGLDELQYRYEVMEEQGHVPDEPVQPSRASVGESSTSLAPKRRNEEEGGVRPAKKRRKMKKTAFFSRETERLLSTYEDAIENCRETIKDISMKLQNVSCTESKEFLETFRKNIELLAEHKPIDKIYIGVFGRTGAGKSSLINAIVNESHILPSGESQACTSVIVYVEANTKSDKYRADIELMSKQDWDAELRFLLETLSKDQDDRTGADTEYDDDDDEMRDMAKEKIKSLYGEEGLEKGYDKLVGNQRVSDILRNSNISLTFDTAEDLSENIGRYIRSDRDGGSQYWPLVKRVTISLPRSPALLDRIVLVDLPGAGDANKQRDEMWKECLSQCASVWIVSDINRALSDKEAQKIFQESLRSIAGGGECHNITFICTKTDNINPKGLKKNEKITDEQLQISEFKGSPDFKKREKRACILHRNKKVKEEFMKNHKVKVKNLLLGENVDSDKYFDVFTVSSEEYSAIEEGEDTTLDRDETELPMLIEHMKKLYVWHSEKAVKDYVSEVAGVITFLQLSKNPCNAKIASFTSKEFRRLEKVLNDECEKLHKFLTDVQSKLRNNLVKGVKEAEKHCLTNGRKVLEPKKKCFSSYHRTLKAMCKNSGYFRSRKGDIVDLNYTLAEPMYTNMNDSNVFLQTFSPGGSRQSIYGKLDSFQESFITPWHLDACKKEPEKYLRMVYIKTKQRKLLSSVEKEILQRKKSVYDSISKSVQATMMPAYRDFSGIGTYTMAKIQGTLKDKILSSKSTIFQQAMNEMLRQFDDLKTWTVKELETQMRADMRVALRQIPDDFINLPDVDEEFQNMKSWCEVLDLRIFV